MGMLSERTEEGTVLWDTREYIDFVVAQKATKNCDTNNKDVQLDLQAYSERGNLYTYPSIIIFLTLSSSFF